MPRSPLAILETAKCHEDVSAGQGSWSGAVQSRLLSRLNPPFVCEHEALELVWSGAEQSRLLRRLKALPSLGVCA
ncbi:hypothetical protein CLOP_g2366 [Closterium sp. NIES-67]|nr:hypothetical protein CLOP_g2366 [Closterium sp. NIES-67]